MSENANNKNNLFREKNLERIENPEKLNDYLRVTNPGVWLILGTIIVILAGICIWGVFGRITATTPAAIVTQDGISQCLVPYASIEGVMSNRIVKVDGEELALSTNVSEPELIQETMNVYMLLAGNLSVGDVVYPVELVSPLPDDGIVSGELVTEIISPASMFFDR